VHGNVAHDYLSVMKWLLLGCLLLFTGELPAQRDMRVRSALLLGQAEVLMAEGKAAEAMDHYQRSFALDPWGGFAYFNAVMAALAAGDTAAANAFLSAGVQHGFDTGVITGDDDFIAFLSSPASRPFHERKAQDQAIWATHADSTLIKVLDSLVVEDQRYRQAQAADLRNRHLTDSLNFEYLIDHCERNGFPDPRGLGHGIGDLHLLLWHHRSPEYPDSDQWQRMLPHIQRAVGAGLLGPGFLCAFDDFSSWERGEPMRWGVLVSYFAQVPEEIYLADPETMDRDRASVGLTPIRDALRLAGLGEKQVRFMGR
jgi:tetratricopeptide (TPR) repeat protein